MMSVETATSGIAARIALEPPEVALARGSERCIAFSTRSEPDCSGKWMCSQTVSHSAMASITSGVKSCGCGLVNRIRRMPSTSFTCAQELGEQRPSATSPAP